MKLCIKITISFNDAYKGTAIPVVAALKQMITGDISGVHYMGQCVDPDRFIKDIERLGAKVSIVRF